METKLIIILLTCFIFQSGNSLFAKTKREPSSKRSGTNVGGGNLGSSFDVSWSRDQVSKLKAYQKRASTKLNKKGDYFEANNILVSGLAKVLQRTDDTKSFTKKSITRGLEILNLLTSFDQNANQRDLRALYRLINKYYTFVIYEAALKLDYESYFPMIRARRLGNDSNYVNQFENDLVFYASRQLVWLNDQLASIIIRYGDIEISPTGSSQDYLKAAEVLTQGAATDLIESIYGLRFICAIEELKSLNEQIVSYNEGDTDIFEDDRVAVASIYIQIEKIIKNLESEDSCL